MRTFLKIVLSILFLLLILDYLLIPNPIIVRRSSTILMNKEGLFRIFTKDNNWKKVLDDGSGGRDTSSNEFYYKKKLYHINFPTISSIDISINDKGTKIPGALIFLPHKSDSTTFLWQATMKSSQHPFTRITNYLQANNLSAEIGDMLIKLSNTYRQVKNVYGVAIQKEFVSDSSLIFKSKKVKGFPTTKMIYSMVDDLKIFVDKASRHITGYPMLNITTTDSNTYVVRVALPIDKEVSSAKGYEYKKMLGRGNILRSEVTGGYQSINNAFNEIYSYISDNHYVIPAIPYQSLVTDRRLEQDTSKWVTNLYYPVM